MARIILQSTTQGWTEGKEESDTEDELMATVEPREKEGDSWKHSAFSSTKQGTQDHEVGKGFHERGPVSCVSS